MGHEERDPANLAMIERMIFAAGRRAGSYDPDQLARLQALHDVVDDATVTAIAVMRAAGVHWLSIGAGLGVTKEAVIQRWGPHVADRTAGLTREGSARV